MLNLKPVKFKLGWSVSQIIETLIEYKIFIHLELVFHFSKIYNKFVWARYYLDILQVLKIMDTLYLLTLRTW